MNKVTIYHNPRCSKSRQTLSLLEEQGVTPNVIEYLKTPPSVEKLGEILTLLELSPRELMRKKEAPYAELNLADASMSKAELINAMVNNPVLIERPIVLANGKAAIGRPPENVLALL
ncbi:MAG: arsenate reductase (glutaredoxin) [Gammaproteobacteria bacterium]|nr:MAG: arsenate reductase (glutaredoxin) [Gammaproteobacteria bacterium]TDJ36839.1 MAG: arsenate reductase (glutaredoxin) [Gammaproteobacteria bacterium]